MVAAHDLVIRRGHVVDFATGLDAVRDIAVDSGRIVAIEESIGGVARSVIDAEGCYVLPGLVDLHVHLDAASGGDLGHAMLARAGVTTALELGTPAAADVIGVAQRSGAGLNIATLVRLIPGVHLPASPSRAEIKAAVAGVLADGALGVKLHVDASWPVETAAGIAEEVNAQGAWLALHCGTSTAGSNLEGLRQAVEYLGPRHAHIAHVNSYCRGDLLDPDAEAREAVSLLRSSPHLFSESYLAEINGNSAECVDGLPRVQRLAQWLQRGGYPGTQDGLRAAIMDGWAAIPHPVGDQIVLHVGSAGVSIWEDAQTRTGLCLPLNPAASRVALAASKDDHGDFDVAAIATDGGAYPRNVTLRAGLSLVELGVLSVSELVKKASWTPARVLGLDTKGTLAVGADADIAVVDRMSRTVASTVSAGRVVFHHGTVISGPTRFVTTERGADAVAAKLDTPTVIDVAASGLYTGAGRSR